MKNQNKTNAIRVPFNRPVVLDDALSSLKAVVSSGVLAGNGPVTKKCEQALEALTHTQVRLVSSASHALDMMGLLLDIQPGDEVICPSFTFVSSASAFALRGAKIHFADNDEHGNILISEVERLATPKTKVVMAMNYAGGAADLVELQAVCKKKNLILVEDAAQSIGASLGDKALGTFGALGCFSFHETKNITSGEGGALLINDPALLENAEIVREKGTNRLKFMQGLVDKYTWVGLGSSYVLSDLNAGYLLPQLKQLDAINGQRLRLWKRYEESLSKPFAEKGVRTFQTPKNCRPNGHIFAFVFRGAEDRNRFLAYMRESGIQCTFHYLPLHRSPMGMKFSLSSECEKLIGCESLSDGLCRFPIYFGMTDTEQDFVIETALRFLKT